MHYDNVACVRYDVLGHVIKINWVKWLLSIECASLYFYILTGYGPRIPQFGQYKVNNLEVEQPWQVVE